jgi:hypothetical protein
MVLIRPDIGCVDLDADRLPNQVYRQNEAGMRTFAHADFDLTRQTATHSLDVCVTA